MGLGEGGFGEGGFGGDEQIVVQLDDGSKRALTSVTLKVMDMWEQALRQMGL